MEEEEILRFPFLLADSQAQPEPKRVAAAADNFSFKVLKSPKSLLICAANSPSGSLPPCGDNNYQTEKLKEY